MFTKKQSNIMTILLNRLLPYRQIIVVDERKSASYALSRFFQITFLTIFFCFLCWIAYTSSFYCQFKDMLRLQKQRKNHINKLIGERNEIIKHRGQLEARVEDLEQKLSNFYKIQTGLVGKLSEWTNDNSEELEKILNLTGLNVSALLAEYKLLRNNDSNVFGAGGPFIAYASKHLKNPSEYDFSDEGKTNLVALGNNIERWEAIKYLLGQLPLSSPLDHFRITSNFGMRKDPINGKYSMHNGLDLTSYLKAPILATAPGTVAFSGWRYRYGKLVEIDHGLGIHTCYGHLHKSFVKRGEKVEFRQKIGLMGNSGRSTGPHVHYEIRVHGKHQDPLKLIIAGKFVLKG